MTIPATALAIIQATAWNHSLEPGVILCPPGREARDPPRVTYARRMAWRALRGELREDGKPLFTMREIGSWFGVSAEDVGIGLKRLRTEA